jgi:hypothetical protein
MKTYRCSQFTVALFLWVTIADSAWARAGGGGYSLGGHSRGSGTWWDLIVLPIVLIYAAIVTLKVREKSQACKELLTRLEKLDPVWNLDAISRRISQVFFKVQEAWMERDQNLAKDCMSQAIFNKHKMQTDQMIADHQRNVLEDIRLIETNIVDVQDFTDNKKDLFWVYIKGEMRDFIADDRTRDIVSGEDKIAGFTELWKFIRTGDNWVLDEIDPKVSLFDLNKCEAKTDSPAV